MKLYASASHIWSVCTGQPKLSESLPKQEKTDAALEGDAAHEVAESIIRHHTAPSKPDFIGIGGKTSNNIIVTQEIFDGAKVYADDYLNLFNTYDPKDIVGGIEDDINLSSIIHTKCTARCDSWLYIKSINTLVVYDFKFGHVYVDPYKNTACTLYAGGLIQRLKLSDDTKVIIKIVQPRVYKSESKVFEWVTDAADIKTSMYKIHLQAHEATGPAAKLKTSTACRRCSCRYSCGPALELGMQLYEMISEPLPIDLSPENIGIQLQIIDRAVEQLKGLQTGYMEQAKQMLKAGNIVPGYTLKPAYGREKWKGGYDKQRIADLVKLMGFNISKLELITPNQAKAKGIDEQFIKLITEIPTNGTKLVSEPKNTVSRIFKGESHD
jgi:hypothetical protein